MLNKERDCSADLRQATRKGNICKDSNDSFYMTFAGKERASIKVTQESISLHFLPIIHTLEPNHSIVNCAATKCHWFFQSFEHIWHLYLDHDQPQSHLFLEGTVQTVLFNALLMQIDSGWWHAVARCFWVNFRMTSCNERWMEKKKKYIHDPDYVVDMLLLSKL